MGHEPSLWSGDALADRGWHTIRIQCGRTLFQLPNRLIQIESLRDQSTLRGDDTNETHFEITFSVGSKVLIDRRPQACKCLATMVPCDRFMHVPPDSFHRVRNW